MYSGYVRVVVATDNQCSLCQDGTSLVLSHFPKGYGWLSTWGKNNLSQPFSIFQIFLVSKQFLPR